MSSAFSSNNDHRAPLKASSSGLKLVLPSLKSVLEAKNKKAKPRSASISFPSPAVQDVIETVEKKPPRPVKLKPLKEVLGKLITQIKKFVVLYEVERCLTVRRKDDYAFFLAPVDAENVPGYLDVVKCPMDLGTMTEKVNRGRYRSLDEFANDLRLVTTNAKIFNPPGSIYYTEAERIEAWGLDHIGKAAGTVIQHEADWNIDIEKEDDTPTTVQVEPMEEEEDRMDVDDQSRARSVSVVSQPQPGSTRRGPRGPYKKNAQPNTPQISESIDSEGRLPGSKDGVGAFPPESDWAKMMLSLKLKGKWTMIPLYSNLTSRRQEVQNKEGTHEDRKGRPTYASGGKFGLYRDGRPIFCAMQSRPRSAIETCFGPSLSSPVQSTPRARNPTLNIYVIR
jgi:bromodomain-containing protein 7/9